MQHGLSPADLHTSVSTTVAGLTNSDCSERTDLALHGKHCLGSRPFAAILGTEAWRTQCAGLPQKCGMDCFSASYACCDATAIILHTGYKKGLGRRGDNHLILKIILYLTLMASEVCLLSPDPFPPLTPILMMKKSRFFFFFMI